MTTQSAEHDRQWFKGLIAIAGIVMAIGGSPATAQSPACQPPNPREFILLVVSRSPETQARVRRTINRDANVRVCNYLGETVTRIAGFRDLDIATSWANYFSDTVGLQAYVARPRTTSATRPQSLPQSTSDRYSPQRLGAGYAVIVNHNNRPEVATQVQQLLNRNIGLASYGQRPYLLAVHTSDRKIANSILRTLSDRGFSAIMVDSRRVTLLTPVVRLEGAIGGQ